MPNPFEEIKVAEKLISAAKALTAKGDDASAVLFEDVGMTKAVSPIVDMKALPKAASEQSVVIGPSEESTIQPVSSLSPTYRFVPSRGLAVDIKTSSGPEVLANSPKAHIVGDYSRGLDQTEHWTTSRLSSNPELSKMLREYSGASENIFPVGRDGTVIVPPNKL